MNALKSSVIVVVGMLAAAAPAGAATLYFDFGSAGLQTGSNYNNVTPSMLPIFNAIDSTGAGTGIMLETAGFNELGPNTAGTQAPTGDAAIFDPEATRDSLFGHSSNFNAGGPRTPGYLVFSGLDGTGATEYSFTFFGSRIGGPNRETQYDVAGASNASVLLDAADNTSNVAIVAGIVPNANGEILVTVSAGPANGTGADQFFYIGALKLESGAVIPEPASAMLMIMAVLGVALASRVRQRS